MSLDADADAMMIVKFDTDTLPPILNALTTDNAGQKLVLEVAVCIKPNPNRLIGEMGYTDFYQ